MTDQEGARQVVPLRPAAPSVPRTNLVARGRKLARELSGEAQLKVRWGDSIARDLHWVSAYGARGRVVAFGRLSSTVGDWKLIWGTPGAWESPDGDWVEGTLPFHHLVSSGSVSGTGLLAVATGRQGSDQFVHILDVDGTATDVREVLRLGYHDPVRSLDFSPDSSRLVVGTLNGTVRLVDVHRGEELLCIGPTMDSEVGHIKRVNAVLYHSSGSSVLSGSRDGSASLWDALTGKELRRFSHQADLSAVAFAREGGLTLTAGTDGLIKLWDTSRGAQVGMVPSDTLTRAVAVSPDDKWLVWGSGVGQVSVWSLEHERRVGALQLDDSEISRRAVRRLHFLKPKEFLAIFESGAVAQVSIERAS